MIVVAGGTASRFGGDKLIVEVAGRPLISHTVDAVSPGMDITVVVARSDLVEAIRSFGHDAVVTSGGETRTDSELAGLTALGREYDLIGIHDGARPLISRELIEVLFETADTVGGAAPTLDPGRMLIDAKTQRPLTSAMSVQTPQVFQGPGLLAAYVKAAQTSVTAQDSVEVVQRFGDLEIAAVPGDPLNIKVTYPEDLEKVRPFLAG
jgi:2-C-methyl-D-erythritol 4-phosphate cytidylyltransferase